MTISRSGAAHVNDVTPPLPLILRVVQRERRRDARPQHDAQLEAERVGDPHERAQLRIAQAVQKVTEAVRRQPRTPSELVEREPVRTLPIGEVGGHRGEAAIERGRELRMIAEGMDPGAAVPGTGAWA